MKKYLFFAASLALCTVYGEENDVEEVEIKARASLNLPEFPEKSSIAFFESFQGDSLSSLGWVLSTAEAYAEQDVVLASIDSAFEGDKALQLGKKHVRYGISKKLPTPLDMTSNEIVIQFESRTLEKLSCSGAYIKFVSEEVKESQENFSEETDYVIMFGPDKCGSSPKLHAIFKHKNPISGEYEEKHMMNVQRPDNDKVSHVYTLVINNEDSTVKVFVDQSEKAVSVATEEKDFEPSFLPNEEIDDPNDSKPEDWVDESRIADPDAIKPEDWVVEAYITDPESSRPDDWDDEEDGEWEAAQISNPEFKGEWKAPLIDNPDYKGVWAPQKIKNPNFFVQEFPLKTLSKISHVFLEVLANDEGISFDNILITTNAENAKVLAESQALEKQKIEQDIVRTKEAKKEKEERERKLDEEFGVVAVLEYASGEAKAFFEKHTFEVLGGVGVVVVLFMYMCVMKSSTDEKEEEAAKKKDDDKDDSGEEAEEEEEKPKSKSVRRRPRKAD